MRSISTIISTLRTSFRDADFTEAESELRSMEDKLRSDYNASELQRSNLSVQILRLEEENRRLQREFEISDRRESELARELSVVKEREKKGIERYERLMKEVRVLEEEKEKILEELCEKNEEVSKLRGVGRYRDEVNEKIRVFEKKKSELEVKLEGLVVMKAKADEEMEKMRRDLKDENKGLRWELCEKYEEICQLKSVERENEGQMKELFERNEILESEMERVKRKVVVLEMERCDLEAKFDELCRENERLVADVKGKDKSVEELKRKVKGLEMEKSKVMKEKEEVSRKYEEEVEERLLKVEEDVANWLLENVSIAKKLMGEQVETVISGVLNALDSQQDGWTDPVVDIVERDSVASHLNDAEVKTSFFEKEVPRESKAMDPKRDASPTLECLSDTEDQRVIGTIGVKRDAFLEVIVLSDSDCDNEDLSRLNELKRQRVLSPCKNQSIKLDSELQPPIAASHRSDKFITSKKQEVAPLRQCNETNGDYVEEPMSRATCLRSWLR